MEERSVGGCRMKAPENVFADHDGFQTGLEKHGSIV